MRWRRPLGRRLLPEDGFGLGWHPFSLGLTPTSKCGIAGSLRGTSRTFRSFRWRFSCRRMEELVYQAENAQMVGSIGANTQNRRRHSSPIRTSCDALRKFQLGVPRRDDSNDPSWPSLGHLGPCRLPTPSRPVCPERCAAVRRPAQRRAGARRRSVAGPARCPAAGSSLRFRHRVWARHRP